MKLPSLTPDTNQNFKKCPQMALMFGNLLERLSKRNESSYTDSDGLVGGKDKTRVCQRKSSTGQSPSGPQLEGQRQDRASWRNLAS